MGEQKNIKVVVRVRPYNRRELEQAQRCIVKVMDKTTLLFDPDEEDDEFFFQGMKQNYRDITKRTHKKLSMEYDRVYDTETTNDQIFEECTAPLIDSVLNGYNCSVFVYGATGAGKTYTMLGSENTRGITYLTMKDLFEKIQKQSDVRKFDVGVSYVEVYNEQVMNLLTKSGPMKLREDSNGVAISGLVLKPIQNADELLKMLAHGNGNRTQHPTDANSESSRSHAIFQVHIRMTEKKTGIKRMVKLSMIDLAGSERAASTKGIGVRFKEGASINKSLLALGNCINKLADGLKHIPYRDSNLTRILKDSLGGNCQTLMVANVSMSSLTYEDTYNTLKYASRAKKIRTLLRQNELKSNMPKEFYIKKVHELMEANKHLESKLSEKEKEVACGSRFDENELKMWFDKIDAVYCIIVRTQEYVYGMHSKEKIFKFRKKIQEDAEVCRKILTIDQGHQDTFANFAASVTRFGKQLENQRDDLMRWRKKLQDAHKDLEKLRKEIKESKCSEVLQPYLKGKDVEIQYSKQKTRLDHISLINGHYLIESDKMRKSFIAACETLRKTAESLSSENSHLKSELESKIEKVRTIVCDYEANLLDEVTQDINDDIDIQMDQDVEATIKGKCFVTKYGAYNDDKEAKKQLRIKRLCNGTDSDWGLDMLADTDSETETYSFNSTFKKPKTLKFADQSNRVKNPNETQVLSTDSDCNSSFELCTPSSSSLARINAAKKQNIVSNILSENNVRVQPSTKTQQLKNVLLKSNMSRQGILKNVSACSKENKKFSPNRVRKSPRSVVSRAFYTTANLVRKAPTRTMNGNSEPAVRINRAASFRVKK